MGRVACSDMEVRNGDGLGATAVLSTSNAGVIISLNPFRLATITKPDRISQLPSQRAPEQVKAANLKGSSELGTCDGLRSFLLHWKIQPLHLVEMNQDYSTVMENGGHLADIKSWEKYLVYLIRGRDERSVNLSTYVTSHYPAANTNNPSTITAPKGSAFIVVGRYRRAG